MTEPGQPEVTLADIIVASGAAEASLDQDRFYEALEEHKQHMPSEEELLRRQVSGSRVSFRVRPNESMGRPLVSRLVEGDANAETTIGQGKEVTPGFSFVAQRYKNYHGKSGAGHEGGLEFANGFAIVNDHRGVVRGLIRKNVVSVAIRNLGKVDITESRGGVIVTQWKNGELLVPGGEAEPEEIDEPEPERERIELRPRAEVVGPPKEIRFGKTADVLTGGEIESIRNGVEIAKGIFEQAAPESLYAAGHFDNISRHADTGEEPVMVGGIPARVVFSSERYMTRVGRAGDPRRFVHEDVRGSIVSITFNPDNPDLQEVVELDLASESIVEEIASLGRSMSIDGERADPRRAAYKMAYMVREAAEALLERAD